MEATLYNIQDEEMPACFNSGKNSSQHIIVFDTSKLPRPKHHIITFADNSVSETWPDVKAAAKTLSEKFNCGTVVFNRYTEFIPADTPEVLEKLGHYEGEIVEGKLQKLRKDEQGFVSYYELLWAMDQYIKDVFEPSEEKSIGKRQDGEVVEVERLHIDKEFGVVMPNIVINILFSGTPVDIGRQVTEMVRGFYETVKDRPVSINCISFNNNINANLFYSNLWRNGVKSGSFLYGYNSVDKLDMVTSAASMRILIKNTAASLNEPLIFLQQEIDKGDGKFESFNIRATRLYNDKSFILIRAAEVEKMRTMNSFLSASSNIPCRVKTNWSRLTEVNIRDTASDFKVDKMLHEVFTNLYLFSLFTTVNFQLSKINLLNIKKGVEKVQSTLDVLDVVDNDKNITPSPKEEISPPNFEYSDASLGLSAMLAALIDTCLSRNEKNDPAAFNAGYCNLAHSFSSVF